MFMFVGKHTKSVHTVPKRRRRSSQLAWQVKDLAWSLLWCEFDPWSVNFCMLWARPKKKKKKSRGQGGKNKGEYYKLFNSLVSFTKSVEKLL